MTVTLGNYTFNESRINTILQSETLEEAQTMGLVDRVIDFFRGGVKRAAIETAFKQITAADRDHGLNPEAKQLARFEALRSMAKPEHAGKFNVDVALDTQAGKWSYAFSIDGTKMASKVDLPLGSGHDYIAYQDASILGKTAQSLVDAGHPEALDSLAMLSEQFATRNSEQHNISAFEADAAGKFVLLAQTLANLQLPMEIVVKDRSAYELSINDQAVHRGQLQTEDNDTEGQFVNVIAARVLIANEQTYRTFAEMLENPQLFIEANVQSMVDDKDEREKLLTSMTDPAFSRIQFKGFKESSDKGTFVANFGDKEFVFSNRFSSRNELRSDRLKDLLQNSDYSCLEDIAKHGHLTEADSMLIYTFTPVQHIYFDIHKRHMSRDECAMLDKAVAGIKIGETTLGALWKLDSGHS